MKVLAALTLWSFAIISQATTLTFDRLVAYYGGGWDILDVMTSNQQDLSYKEAGFVLTLHTENPSIPPGYGPNGPGAHIGDGTDMPGTFNWHDGGINLDGSYVTLTSAEGSVFDLISFNYYAAEGQLTISAIGYADFLANSYLTNANQVVNFYGVTTVTFIGYGVHQLDNMVLNATSSVPEPVTYSLLITGLGLVGSIQRRRKQNY